MKLISIWVTELRTRFDFHLRAFVADRRVKRHVCLSLRYTLDALRKRCPAVAWEYLSISINILLNNKNRNVGIRLGVKRWVAVEFKKKKLAMHC